MALQTQRCESNNKTLLYVLLLNILFGIILPVLESACGGQEFECNDGTCIPKSWECDYESDCKTGEDEGDQCSDCETAGYVCRQTGKCIPPQWKCDNWTDCLLQDDERFCNECNENQFKCNDGECISLDKLCDYNKDCYNGEDENLTLSTQKQIQLNPPDNAKPVQCQTCESKLNNGTIMCNGKCILGNNCDGIIDCFDLSDECMCDNEDNPYKGKCNNTIQTTVEGDVNNTIETTNFQRVHPNDDDAPKWKYCPESITWLAFITYDDTDVSYIENPKLKAMVKPNKTQVYWIVPKLRNFVCANGKLCDDYQVISDTKPGAKFVFGKHQVRYVGRKADSIEDEAVTCVINILVLGGMTKSEIDECINSNDHKLVNYDFTVDKNYYIILDSNKLDGKDVDITTARYYLPTKSQLNCYASIAFKETIPIDNNVLYNAIDWMVDHVWPIIGLVIGIILLICGLCCGILCLWRKQAEYKAYEAADDFENTDDDDSDENEDTIGITSGQPIHQQNHPYSMSLSHHSHPSQHRLSLSHQDQPILINPNIHPNINPNNLHVTPNIPPHIHASMHPMSPNNNHLLIQQQQVPFYQPTNPVSIQRTNQDVIIRNNNNDDNKHEFKNDTHPDNHNKKNNDKVLSKNEKRRRSILGTPIEKINVNKLGKTYEENDDCKSNNDKDNDEVKFLDNEWGNGQERL